MIYSIIFLVLAALSYWLWRYKFIPQEVARNAAAIVANGSADDLQRGFHQRESWRRVWVGLACCVVPALPLLFGEGARGWAAALGFGAMAALLAGSFARWFTPLLNLAMQLDYKSEWYASPASKSWPDAAAYKKARATYATSAAHALGYSEQVYANQLLRKLLTRTWGWCLLAALLLAGGAVAVSL